MNILSIETSCDETAVSVVAALGDFPEAEYTILGNALYSQIDIHREYGGVFPAIAKREHALTLIPMLEKALQEADLAGHNQAPLTSEHTEELHELLNREPGLADQLIEFHQTHNLPEIDMIAVTSGPGLEPALWVGVNFAKALSLLWNVPVVPVNHMEGHVLASIFDGARLAPLTFPALSLLISGGHTELVLMRDWGHYEKIGQTRDDAVGEAFDKVARLLGLPYPGGPEISKLAAKARHDNLPEFASLPRPMIDSDDFDFSYSGLKTAVRYAIADKELSENDKAAIARDFEDAATEVLMKKTARAIEQHGAQSLILGGGVTANSYLRDRFSTLITLDYPDTTLYLPDRALSTDNSIMIALAGHAQAHTALKHKDDITALRAQGNRSLGTA